MVSKKCKTSLILPFFFSRYNKLKPHVPKNTSQLITTIWVFFSKNKPQNKQNITQDLFNNFGKTLKVSLSTTQNQGYNTHLPKLKTKGKVIQRSFLITHHDPIKSSHDS